MTSDEIRPLSEPALAPASRVTIPVEDALTGLIGAARQAGRSAAEKLSGSLGAIGWTKSVGAMPLW